MSFSAEIDNNKDKSVLLNKKIILTVIQKNDLNVSGWIILAYSVRFNIVTPKLVVS